MRNDNDALIISDWPVPEKSWFNDQSEKAIGSIQNLIREIRFLRAELEISPAETCRVQLGFHQSDNRVIIEEHLGYIEQLAKCEIIKTDVEISKPGGAVTGQVDGIDIFLMIEGLVDIKRELQRLNKKHKVLSEDVERIQKRFEKPDFLEKAPQEVIEKDQIRLEKLLSEAQRLQKLIEGIMNQ
jgi:valyl-tRNA synthetase